MWHFSKSRQTVRAIVACTLALAAAILIPTCASATNPCAAWEAKQRAEEKAHLAAQDLNNHLKAPFNTDIQKIERELNSLIVRLNTSSGPVKAAQNQVTGLKLDKAARETQRTNVQTRLTELNTARVADENHAKNTKNSPLGQMVKKYDTAVDKVKAALQTDNLFEAKKRLNEAMYLHQSDAQLQALAAKITDLLRYPKTADEAAQKQREYDARFAVVKQAAEANLATAQTAKAELMSRFGIYPWAPEAEAIRDVDRPSPETLAERAKRAEEISRLTKKREELDADIVELAGKVSAAESALQVAQNKAGVDASTLPADKAKKEKELADAIQAEKDWYSKRTKLENDHGTATEAAKQALAAYNTAVEAAENYFTTADARWQPFKAEIYSHLASVKEQVANAASDEDREKVREAALEWYLNQRNKVVPFTAKLEASPFVGGCGECKKIVALIADARTVTGEIDSIITTLQARLKETAVDLSGSWTCDCKANWTLTRLGENSRSGARYAGSIRLGSKWSCSLAGSLTKDAAGNYTLFLAGNDMDGNPVTYNLAYNKRSGRLVGTYTWKSKDRDPATGDFRTENSAEEAWRT